MKIGFGKTGSKLIRLHFDHIEKKTNIIACIIMNVSTITLILSKGKKYYGGKLLRWLNHVLQHRTTLRHSRKTGASSLTTS
jgi:hypothetical protein